MHTTIFCSVLIIIESTAKFSFKYLFPSAENVQENASHKFENKPENGTAWLDYYWKEYYQAVQLRFPQQRLPLHKKFEGKYINIDKNGWRKVVLEQNQILQDTVTKNKILLFGNSTLWGVGSPDSLTIPSLFAQKLSYWVASSHPIATLKPIEVQNFAVCSWNSTQMLVQLEIELQKGNIPQTVIFLNGATDMSRTLVEGGLSEVQNYEILSQKTASKVAIDSNFIATNMEYLLQRVYSYKILRKLQNLSPYRLAENNINAQNNSQENLQNLQNVAKAVAINYFKNYTLIDSLSRQYKFKYLVCWQPFSLKRAEEMHPEDIFFRNFAAAVNREIVQQNQLNLYPNFYNLADCLVTLQNKEGNLFLDYCHLTTLGNQYLVDILLEYYKK